MNLRKSLCTLSADDYNIISRCNLDLQNRFAAIGLFVFCIFVICFLSFFIAFTTLFQNFAIGVLIGIIFSVMITNIYLLILYTLSKNTLPVISDTKSKIFSIGIRLTFVCFIAVIVSKPIEVFLFSGALNHEIEIHRNEEIKSYSDSINKYFTAEIAVIKLIADQEKIQSSKNIPNTQLEYYENLIERKSERKNESIKAMAKLVNNNTYFLYGIKVLCTKYLGCWVFTFFIIVIFLAPAYLKNYIGEQEEYFLKKKQIETQIVVDEYSTFKIKYSQLFQQSQYQYKQFSESFIDAPFNTIRKTDGRQFAKEEDLVSDLYNA